jgi:hypothetical protein
MQRWREQGLRSIDRNEPSSLYFAEWSPPPDLSPMTAQAWAYANPALGKTLTLKTIEAESENPDRASFLASQLQPMGCQRQVMDRTGFVA